MYDYLEKNILLPEKQKGKIINKINRNADSYYVNEKDMESILPSDAK